MWVFRAAIGGAAAASTSDHDSRTKPIAPALVCERRERRNQRIEVVVWLLLIVALAGAYAIVLLMTVCKMVGGATSAHRPSVLLQYDPWVLCAPAFAISERGFVTCRCLPLAPVMPAASQPAADHD